MSGASGVREFIAPTGLCAGDHFFHQSRTKIHNPFYLDPTSPISPCPRLPPRAVVPLAGIAGLYTLLYFVSGPCFLMRPLRTPCIRSALLLASGQCLRLGCLQITGSGSCRRASRALAEEVPSLPSPCLANSARLDILGMAPLAIYSILEANTFLASWPFSIVALKPKFCWLLRFPWAL